MKRCDECMARAEGQTWSSETVEDRYEQIYRANSSWQPVEARCGGVSINGADPVCCEVHMQPWGHRRLHAH